MLDFIESGGQPRALPIKALTLRTVADLDSLKVLKQQNNQNYENIVTK